MAKQLCYADSTVIADIANAIREKNGETASYLMADMPSAIRAIEASGPAIEPETPTIQVSTSGLITASANGLSATQQLTTQAARTITPSEQQQTAVASGRYTTGAITVSAIPSTYIGSGVTINKYYTGSSTPASSLGNNGDLYLMVSTSSDEVEEENPIAP